MTTKFYYRQLLFLLILLSLSIYTLKAQTPFLPVSPKYESGRIRTITITEAALTTVTMIGLHYLWYKKFPHSRFHFFNDNKEWLGMDKVGHATTAYNISSMQHDIMRWCGVKPGASALIGCLTALGFMSMIEIFDGFSSNWGFSVGDMLANISGILLFAGQQYIWGNQRLQLRFSYHNTIFPKYNPAVLGNHIQEKILKDYNGQTYWLSINLPSFFNARSGIPSWLTASAGYGADGMTGASANPASVDGKAIPSFTRAKQYYFSVGYSMQNFTPKGFFTGTIKTMNQIIQFPSPTLKFQKNKPLKFYSLYF